MSKTYDVSFIIPVYNVEKYIESCLDSILEQEDVSKEIIVVDDGSTDKSLDILKKYKEKCDDIVLVCQENQGASVARNKGIELAKGTWISFVDSDDYLETNCIKYILENVSEDYDVVFADYVNYTQTKVHRHSYGESELNFETEDFENFQRATLNKNYIPKDLQLITPWSKLYRRSFLQENNIRYTPGVRKSQDLLFNFEVYHFAQKGKYVPVLMYYYRYNRESLCNKYLVGVLNDYLKQQERIKSLLELYGNYESMKLDYYFRCAVNYMFSLRLDFAHTDNPKKYEVRRQEFEESLKVAEVWEAICGVNEAEFSFKEKVLLNSVRNKNFWLISALNWGYNIIEKYL